MTHPPDPGPVPVPALKGVSESGRIGHKATRVTTARLMRPLRVGLAPGRPARGLPVADQQSAEIAESRITVDLPRAAATEPTVLAAGTGPALALTACGGTTEDDAEADSAAAAPARTAGPDSVTNKDLTAGFLPKQVDHPCFTTADKGGERALAELGSHCEEAGRGSASCPFGQVSHVNTLTRQRVDAVAVSAQGPGARCAAPKQAVRGGIKVVTHGSDTTLGCKDPKYKHARLVRIAYGNDAAQYPSGSTYEGKVRLTGLRTPNDPRRYVRNGIVEVFALWDPARPGALGARTAVAPASGRISGRPGETSTSGGTTYTLGGNGVFDLGEPAVSDARTIDRYHFRENGDCSCSVCASC
ncbi:substrate-binding domain-containing protein [Streptomyces eurythermus]